MVVSGHSCQRGSRASSEKKSQATRWMEGGASAWHAASANIWSAAERNYASGEDAGEHRSCECAHDASSGADDISEMTGARTGMYSVLVTRTMVHNRKDRSGHPKFGRQERPLSLGGALGFLP